MTTPVRLLTLVLLLLLPGCAMPSGMEWVVGAGIALLLFGGAKLPGLMRSMGSGVHEFKKGLKDGEKEDETEGGDKPKELESKDD